MICFNIGYWENKVIKYITLKNWVMMWSESSLLVYLHSDFFLFISYTLKLSTFSDLTVCISNDLWNTMELVIILYIFTNDKWIDFFLPDEELI